LLVRFFHKETSQLKHTSVRTSLLLAITLLALPLLMVSAQSSPSAPGTFTGEITDSICAQNGSHTAMMAKNATMGHDSETCVKQCAAIGAKYVLVSDSNKTVYTLDDPAKAQALAGHKVRVSGTLQQNQIKVASIDVIG
jgi:hypothetical protein